MVIARRLEKPRSLPSLLKKRKPLTLKQQQEFLIESLPGIGPQISRSLLTRFGTIKNLVNAKEEELMQIEKIGKIKASQIKKVLEENYKED